MISQKDMHIFSYKDESPLNTVNRIKSILKQHNVNTTENWYESNVPNCHIVTVSADGTSFRTTGKGLTPELALASGYGEFIERFQLGYIGRQDVQKDGSGFSSDTQSELLPAKQLLEHNKKWYEKLSDRLCSYIGKRYSAEELVMQYADENGNVLCTPFYSVTTDTKEYLPVGLRRAAYTASGCASGNTPEEAIVHAISEIMERYSLIKATAENITPPDIPDDVLKQFKYVYSIITYLREHNYKVIVKDCSFGSIFPVICVVFINQRNGRYHTHYGADPILEIAIERALVEPFQGRTIENFTQHDFLPSSKNGIDVNVLQKEITWGAAEKPYFFFTGEASYEYNANMGIPGCNNRQLFNMCVQYFKDMGYDILIRDCSCLSFPTYQVIIPGYSEVACHRISPEYEDKKAKQLVAKAMKNLSSASFDDLINVMQYLGKTSDSFSKIAGLHLKIEDSDEKFLFYSAAAHLHYTMMQYATTARIVDLLLNYDKKEHEDYLICIKRYLTMIDQENPPSDIKSILMYFHRPETVDKMFSYVDNDQNPFDDFIVHCNLHCSEDCYLYKYCCRDYITSLIQLINDKTNEMDFNDSMEKIRTLID